MDNDDADDQQMEDIGGKMKEESTLKDNKERNESLI